MTTHAKVEAAPNLSAKSFKTYFRTAITEARKEGKIQLGQYAALWFISMFPKQLTKIEELVEHEAAANQKFAAGEKGVMEWIAIIKELLPLILSIIDMFKSSSTADME